MANFERATMRNLNRKLELAVDTVVQLYNQNLQ